MKRTAAEQALNRAIRDHVVTLGGTPNDEDILGPSATIETVAGSLYVSGMGTWVHCRFADTARANAHFGNTERKLGHFGAPNPFTGKYNFHADGGAKSFEAFKAALARLLPVAK